MHRGLTQDVLNCNNNKKNQTNINRTKPIMQWPI